jgi:hypothetical protein
MFTGEELDSEAFRRALKDFETSYGDPEFVDQLDRYGSSYRLGPLEES